jgi:NAD(P)-dependent dehydrogenase (short-subunit alcohol dehydrogenase family)
LIGAPLPPSAAAEIRRTASGPHIENAAIGNIAARFQQPRCHAAVLWADTTPAVFDDFRWRKMPGSGGMYGLQSFAAGLTSAVHREVTHTQREAQMPAEKVAIVTAGGSGMGAAAARRLAADGFKVAILSSSGKGEVLAAELGGFGVTGSNQSNDDLKRLVDGTLQRWSRIDVLVNSAGHGPRAPLLEISDEDWRRGMDVYLMNVIRPTRLVTPAMQKQKGGVIINISTAWVFEPSAMFPTSAVFRAGLAAFTKIFVDTYAGDNIRMNNVLPGWIDSLPATEERRASVPLKRYGTSKEIAAVIAFLASDGAAYITGQSLRVDGGLTRSV